MKELTKEQVNDIVKLKWGQLVESATGPTYTSNKALGKLYGVSASKIRQLYRAHFEEINKKKQPLMQRLQQAQSEVPRKNYGVRFLKNHEIDWLTSS